MELLRTPARRQHGAVLFVTLIIMILMTLAAISAIRATDTSTVIAGNFAFRQAGMQASDRAISDALNNLANIASAGTGNTDVNNRYFSTRRTPLDSKGIPTAITWANVTCNDENGAAVANCDAETGKYRIQYYVERQCTSNPVLADNTDVKTRCDYEVRQPLVTGPPTISEKLAVRYRVIIRARGPRDTTAFYETMVSGPY